MVVHNDANVVFILLLLLLLVRVRIVIFVLRFRNMYNKGVGHIHGAVIAK